MAVKAFGECTDGGIIFLRCFFRRNIDIVVNMGLFFQVLSMFGQLTLDTPKMRRCCCVSCLAETALNFLCKRLFLNDINGTTSRSSRFLDEVELLCFSCGGVCLSTTSTLYLALSVRWLRILLKFSVNVCTSVCVCVWCSTTLKCSRLVFSPWFLLCLGGALMEAWIFTIEMDCPSQFL